MNKNNLYTLLDSIREKPYLYLGNRHLSTLHYTINGYKLYCLHNEIDENLTPKWNDFHDFVAVQLNYAESTTGYKNMILEKNEFDEEKGLIKFYELFDLFRKLNDESFLISTHPALP